MPDSTELYGLNIGRLLEARLSLKASSLAPAAASRSSCAACHSSACAPPSGVPFASPAIPCAAMRPATRPAMRALRVVVSVSAAQGSRRAHQGLHHTDRPHPPSCIHIAGMPGMLYGL